MKIEGNAIQISRLVTGLHSFDRAFTNKKGAIGLPIGSGIEIFGPTHCGKSTVTYGLAGIIAANQKRNIALTDLEGFDPDFLTTVLMQQGFDGTLRYIQEKEDETALDELISTMRKKEYGVGILDSVGAISPIAEQEGELGEANMGQRAKLMAQFTRKAIHLLRDDPKTIFLINHAYPRIGGRGTDSPGGEVMKYLATIRIKVRRRFIKGTYEEYPDGSYVIIGDVEKNRWGLKDKQFLLFVLSGKGIHKGLTALADAENAGLIEKARGIIKINGKSLGRLKEMIDKAQNGDDNIFEPFYEVLNNAKPSDTEPTEDTAEE